MDSWPGAEEAKSAPPPESGPLLLLEWAGPGLGSTGWGEAALEVRVAVRPELLAARSRRGVPLAVRTLRTGDCGEGGGRVSGGVRDMCRGRWAGHERERVGERGMGGDR